MIARVPATAGGGAAPAASNRPDVPLPLIAPGAAPPLLDCRDEHPDGHVRELPPAVSAFFHEPERHATMRELGGVLCARMVAGTVNGGGEVGFERLDLALHRGRVVVRRRPIPGRPHLAFDMDAALREWDAVLPEQRDASVLFILIVDVAVDAYDGVLDLIRARADEAERHLLDRDRPLRAVQRTLLDLAGNLAAVRRHVLSLRNDVRQILRLRAPARRGLITEAGLAWLHTLEEDLRLDLPDELGAAEARIAAALNQLQGERSELTNRIVLALTIVSATIFLPTVLTGLYGMNVPLPGQSHRYVFWAIVGLAVALLAVGLLAIVRLRLVRMVRKEGARDMTLP